MNVVSLSYGRLMMTLLEREWAVYRHRVVRILINFVGIQALTFAFVQGYIKPMMYFGLPIDRRGMMVFAGSLVMLFIRRSFDFGMAYFNDMHQQKHIWYQRLAAPHGAVYGARILFSLIFTWLLTVVFLPVPKLILGSYFDASHINWSLFAFIFLCIATMFTTYSFMCLTIITSRRGIATIRIRINEVLMWMGAFNATWLAIYTSGAHWGYISLCSPFTYATEALRHALYTSGDLIPLWITIVVMLAWSAIFYAVGLWFFARKHEA